MKLWYNLKEEEGIKKWEKSTSVVSNSKTHEVVVKDVF